MKKKEVSKIVMASNSSEIKGRKKKMKNRSNSVGSVIAPLIQI